MGVLEDGLRHIGVPCVVSGAGISNWINAIHKPKAIMAALTTIATEYVVYADSRDALLLKSPEELLDTYLADFSGYQLVFGADRVNFPPNRKLRLFEDSLPGAAESPFKYLNSGMWLGHTSFACSFFQRVLHEHPLPEGPTSDQGLIRQLLPEFEGSIALDYRCRLFQNIGFLARPILTIHPPICQSTSLAPLG